MKTERKKREEERKWEKMRGKGKEKRYNKDERREKR